MQALQEEAASARMEMASKNQAMKDLMQDMESQRASHAEALAAEGDKVGASA